MSIRQLSVAVALITAIAGGLILLWLNRSAGPDSDRQTTTIAAPADRSGSSGNDSLTNYVGHQKCAECHSDIAASHALTGHARTFALTKDSEIAGRLCEAVLTSSEPFGPYDYSCDAEGVLVAIPSRFGTRAFPLDFAVGSGDHAVTFFTLQTKSTGETVGIEHRMTWYHSDETFDVTPGQEGLTPAWEGEFFGRQITPEHAERCIDCHTTTAVLQGDRVNSLYAGVHCEECHGPGAAHVAAAEAGQSAEILSSIQRVQTATDELTLCGRCHRTQADLTAARIADYPPSVVRFQPVGLSLSRCFTQTPGGLKCSRCHDPHEPVNSRPLQQQVDTCLECHAQPHQTVCPVSADQNCVQCHMPAIDLVRGISFHDHWIRVRDSEPIPSAANIETGHATVP